MHINIVNELLYPWAPLMVTFSFLPEHIEDYHPDAADLYSKIALILRQDGDFERAQEEYRFACEIYEMSLGADHPETIKALNEVMEKKRLGQLSNMLKNKLKLKA